MLDCAPFAAYAVTLMRAAVAALSPPGGTFNVTFARCASPAENSTTEAFNAFPLSTEQPKPAVPSTAHARNTAPLLAAARSSSVVLTPPACIYNGDPVIFGPSEVAAL